MVNCRSKFNVSRGPFKRLKMKRFIVCWRVLKIWICKKQLGDNYLLIIRWVKILVRGYQSTALNGLLRPLSIRKLINLNSGIGRRKKWSKIKKKYSWREGANQLKNQKGRLKDHSWKWSSQIKAFQRLTAHLNALNLLFESYI